MADRLQPSLYSIPAHRGFADALVAGLLARYGKTPERLYRATLLLPNRRAERAVTEAFVRRAEDGLILPRMAVIGDLDLNESLGSLLDGLEIGIDIPAAVTPHRRTFELSRIVQEVRPDSTPVEAFRIARDLAATLDRLHIEHVEPRALIEVETGELAEHWQRAISLFEAVNNRWQARLDTLGMVDAAKRRNRLLETIADGWRSRPPEHPVIAAGITTAAPAIAGLLNAIAFAPQSMVVLPDLDLQLDTETWDGLGDFGDGGEERAPIGALTHPQYHLKLLLHRMGVHRDEVKLWPRSGLSDAPSKQSRVISNIFLPAHLSSRWRDIKPADRNLSHVSEISLQNPSDEAQAVALLTREALEVPGRRVAIITPDRGLAKRISAHLKRWQIRADDSAGEPLPTTPAGVFLLELAGLVAGHVTAGGLLGVLKHPLVRSEDEAPRRIWIDQVRTLDLALRGPRIAPGFHAISRQVAEWDRKVKKKTGKSDLSAWWQGCLALFENGDDTARGDDEVSFASLVERLQQTATALCGERVWMSEAGRQAADLLQSLAEESQRADTRIASGSFPAILRTFMQDCAVRPAYGNHPRVAIYGLLEARLQQADLMICAGLNEGVWPPSTRSDPILAPVIERKLGLTPSDFRTGLAAHDLAGALGAPEIVLTRAERDTSGPTIASRFLLRMRAMAGRDMATREDVLHWIDAIDRIAPVSPAERPAPLPATDQRAVNLSVTDLDRLLADPFGFYARKIMGLSPLDAVDAKPSAAWKGSAVHDILQQWKEQDGLDPVKLLDRARAMLDDATAHPALAILWGPRLLAGFEWVAQTTATMMAEERRVAAAEEWATIEVDGVRLGGKIDRLDVLPDGGLAVIDYKTGKPPTSGQVEAGYALQLGLLAMIAQESGFAETKGTVRNFEYWSLSKRQGEQAFGYIQEPVLEGQRKKGLPRDEYVDKTREFLKQAISGWILGSRPFLAKLNPDLAGYTDYDHLMRLDEWFGRADEDNGA